MPLLSILVATLECRREFCDALQAAFGAQMGSDVTLFTLRDDGEETTGAKRNKLLTYARTDYVCSFDDDDLPSDDYCERIVEALKQSPDVVGFKTRITDDGLFAGQDIHTSKCLPYTHRTAAEGKPLRYRWPNHLNPIRTDIARSVGFPDRNCGEDVDYSERLVQQFPNLNEVFIDAELYHYRRRSDKRHEKHNLNP